MSPPIPLTVHPLAAQFHSFVRDPAFPCVGAKAALTQDNMRIIVCRNLGSGLDDLPILLELTTLASDYRTDREIFQTLVVIFHEPERIGEVEFEDRMWERIQSLADKDALLLESPQDSRVSDDPDDPHFSLSFGGEAFFVVGLHPGASRPARRFERPVLVFNLHDQFEQLRLQNRYEKLRTSILDRDFNLTGSINPMLERHGDGSEAWQYSGRDVGSEWVCPYVGRGEGKSPTGDEPAAEVENDK